MAQISQSAFKTTIIKAILDIDGEGTYAVYGDNDKTEFAYISAKNDTILYNGGVADLTKIKGIVNTKKLELRTLALFDDKGADLTILSRPKEVDKIAELVFAKHTLNKKLGKKDDEEFETLIKLLNSPLGLLPVEKFHIDMEDFI